MKRQYWVEITGGKKADDQYVSVLHDFTEDGEVEIRMFDCKSEAEQEAAKFVSDFRLIGKSIVRVYEVGTGKLVSSPYVKDIPYTRRKADVQLDEEIPDEAHAQKKGRQDDCEGTCSGD